MAGDEALRILEKLEDVPCWISIYNCWPKPPNPAISKPCAQVTIAMDGEEALRILEESEEGLPDLVLLDVMMPGMSGYEVRTVSGAPCLPYYIPGLGI